VPKNTFTIHPAFAQAKVFADLTEDELADVAGRFSRRSFSRGENFFIEGSPARIFYLIAEGEVKVLQTSADGFEVILHVLGSGDLIGALPTIGEGTYPATAQAMSDVTAYGISSVDFNEILLKYHVIAVNIIRFATRVIQASHNKVRELATERVERRIARTLIRLANQIGKKVEHGILIDTPLRRKDLAEMTGTTIFTVSRTLKAWERADIISVGREQVTITQPHELIAIGEDLPPESSLR
jgi:CRP-like cAMP-binding protein